MKYKALILDLDGTVIGNDRKITPQVKQAIAKVKDKVPVSLCSGRVYASIRIYVEELGLGAFQICDGGGEIHDPKTGRPVHQKLIPSKTASEIMSDLRQSGFDYLASCNSRYHLDKTFMKDEEVEEKYQFYLPEYPDINEVKNPKITKITVLGVSAKNSKRIEKLLEKYREDIHYIVSAYHLSLSTGIHALDITQKGATKLTALETYAKLMEIDLKEMIVVGDGYNDFPLLMAGGLKIAMGNAVPDLKKIADFVAPSVDEDGVAKVIEKFLFI